MTWLVYGFRHNSHVNLCWSTVQMQICQLDICIYAGIYESIGSCRPQVTAICINAAIDNRLPACLICSDRSGPILAHVGHISAAGKPIGR